MITNSNFQPIEDDISVDELHNMIEYLQRSTEQSSMGGESDYSYDSQYQQNKVKNKKNQFTAKNCEEFYKKHMNLDAERQKRIKLMKKMIELNKEGEICDRPSVNPISRKIIEKNELEAQGPIYKRYEKVLFEKNYRINQLQQMRKDLEESEWLKYPYHPEISELSKKMKDKEDIYQANIEWQTQKNLKIQHQRMQKYHKELQEQQDAPKLSKKSQQIMENHGNFDQRMEINKLKKEKHLEQIKNELACDFQPVIDKKTIEYYDRTHKKQEYESHSNCIKLDPDLFHYNSMLDNQYKKNFNVNLYTQNRIEQEKQQLQNQEKPYNLKIVPPKTPPAKNFIKSYVDNFSQNVKKIHRFEQQQSVEYIEDQDEDSFFYDKQFIESPTKFQKVKDFDEDRSIDYKYISQYSTNCK